MLELVGYFNYTDYFDKLSLDIGDTQSIKLFNACIAVNDLLRLVTLNELGLHQLDTLNNLYLRLVIFNGLAILHLVDLQ